MLEISIAKAIRETLVISNPTSIKYAVEKIMKILEKEERYTIVNINYSNIVNLKEYDEVKVSAQLLKLSTGQIIYSNDLESLLNYSKEQDLKVLNYEAAVEVLTNYKRK